MFWLENKNIAIIFSQKSDGDMLFKTQHPELNEKIRQNRISFFEKNKINSKRLINIAGVHGTHIAMTRHSDLGRGSLDPNMRIPDTDGLIINIRNSYLMATGADCFPAFFYNENKNMIAAAHCGWRGILMGLPLKMIDEFKNDFDSNPADIIVWIGPGIKSCHYDVFQERASLFSKNYKEYIIIKDDKIFLDLAGIIALQLTKAGVRPEKITTHPDCTFCEKDKYFSHRRDKNEIIEANAFIINLK